MCSWWHHHTPPLHKKFDAWNRILWKKFAEAHKNMVRVTNRVNFFFSDCHRFLLPIFFLLFIEVIPVLRWLLVGNQWRHISGAVELHCLVNRHAAVTQFEKIALNFMNLHEHIRQRLKISKILWECKLFMQHLFQRRNQRNFFIPTDIRLQISLFDHQSLAAKEYGTIEHFCCLKFNSGNIVKLFDLSVLNATSATIIGMDFSNFSWKFRRSGYD